MTRDSLWKNPNFIALNNLIIDQIEKLNGEALVNLAKVLRSDISINAQKAKLTAAFFKTVVSSDRSC